MWESGVQPMEAAASADDRTVVAEPGWIYTLLWVAFPLLGIGVGRLLLFAVGWLAGLEWVPLPGPVKLVASIPEPYATLGAVAVGGVAGLVLAHLAAKDRLVVSVAADRVTLTRGGVPTEFEPEAVGAVFLDRGHLVLLGRSTEELTRQSCDLKVAGLEDAFRSHGYPWHDGDPHAAVYRRWVEGLPDLPPGADALLRARRRALDKGDKDDVDDLRRELNQLGIAVREEKKRQYVRRTGQPPELTDPEQVPGGTGRS